MRTKLVLLFDEDCEVYGIPAQLIFNNVGDAERYLLGTGSITFIKIEPDGNFFSFKTTTWSGFGIAYWAIEAF